MAYRADRGYETNLASLLSGIVLRYEKAMMEEKIMINVSLTMKMARDLALFGSDLRFPSRSDRFWVNDSCAVALAVIWILSGGRFIPSFFEKISLDHYRRDLSFSGSV
jgi:hypothetical protein